MSGREINDLLQIWAASLPDGNQPPFTSKEDLYNTIDAINLGDAPWESFNVSFNGDIGDNDDTPWKRKEYTVWMQDARVVI